MDDGEGAALASADYDRLEQGDDATVFAAISADGRYVVIQTLARNFFADDDPDPPGRYRTGGVFRFDLEARTLAKVADGDLYEEDDNELVRRGAFNPATSADGRYVAFTTAQQLVAADTNDHFDVYVRDMEVPVGEPGDFELASAHDGSDAAALYGPPEESLPGGEPGARTARGVAISADGRRVAFQTDAPSNLPASAVVDVPAGQILVRDLDSDSTTLVTAKRDPGSGAMTGEPAGGAISAAISADGTTVAWTGVNAGAQTRFLNGESADPSLPFYLWRRVADGPGAPTRRITGLSDPDDPECPPGEATVFDQISTGPCYGPLTEPEASRSGASDQPPALSGDGYTVAFLTGSGPRPLAFTGVGFDLFLTDMTPGRTRKEATVELTRDPATFDPATSSALSAISMSAGGRYVAVTSVRTNFTLPALQMLGDPRPQPDARELYVVDLESRTLERVAHSTSGGDIDGAVLDGATISGDGSRLAFTSFAGNLFRGDANQRSDAFVATRRPDPEGGPAGKQGDDGPAGTIETEDGGPQIGVRAESRPGGAVILTVSVPAAGSLKAMGKAGAGSPRKPRTLATAAARANGTSRSSVRLVLRPVDRYRSEIRERKTIPGRASVSYVASRGGRRASASVKVVFRQAIAAAKRSKGSRK